MELRWKVNKRTPDWNCCFVKYTYYIKNIRIGKYKSYQIIAGLGFDINEIVQAWNEMYDAKRWQIGVPSFRLEPLFRRRVPKLHQILEHIWGSVSYWLFLQGIEDDRQYYHFIVQELQ